MNFLLIYQVFLIQIKKYTEYVDGINEQYDAQSDTPAETEDAEDSLPE